MIVEIGKHYLYRHIRLDKNEPFYIGIGTKNKNNSEYCRAHTKVNRSKFWNKIVRKSEYETEILLESNDYEFIKQKEIEFIKLYGRIDLGTGTLCNLTDGGDGKLGVVFSEESKRKSSESNKKVKKSEEHIRKFLAGGVEANKKYILQYDMDGNFVKEWRSIGEAAKGVGGRGSSIGNCARGITHYSAHQLWKYKETEDYPLKIEVSDYVKRMKKWFDRNERLKNGISYRYVKVEFTNLLTGETKLFASVKSCSTEIGIKSFYICRLCKSGKIYKSKYKFNYVDGKQ